MKSFWKKGKWMAVLALGAAFLFAGCMGSSSSDDSAIPAKAAGAQYVYKFDFDPQANTLDIKPVVMGTAIQTGFFGHTIDVTTSGCDTTAVIPKTCQVTIENQASGYYIANMRTWSINSTSGSAVLNGSDYAGASYAPGNNAVEGAGFCVLNDAQYCKTCAVPTPASSNPGCQTYQYSGGTKLAVKNILHPDCGTLTEAWTFAADSSQYSFYTYLVDAAATDAETGPAFSWYPEDPKAGDSRMDHTNFSTWVAKAYQIDNACPDSTCVYNGSINLYACVGDANADLDGLKLGAYGCSSPLPANGAVSTGQYFAVNLGIEIADRVENQNHAMYNGTSACFDWYGTLISNVTWDPNVIEALTVENFYVLPSSSMIEVTSQRGLFAGAWSAKGDAGASQYINFHNGMATTPDFVNDATNNYFAIGLGSTGGFSFKGIPPNNTCRPNIMSSSAFAYPNNSPTSAFGWGGLAHFNASCAGMTDEGADNDVDVWLGMTYFKVIGGSGTSSLIKIEPTSDFTRITWQHSNCTRAGGWTGDDIYAYCLPCTNTAGTGPCDNTGAGTFTCGTAAPPCGGLEDDLCMYVHNSAEMTQPQMPGASNAYRGVGYQTQNAHVCVQ